MSNETDEWLRGLGVNFDTFQNRVDQEPTSANSIPGTGFEAVPQGEVVPAQSGGVADAASAVENVAASEITAADIEFPWSDPEPVPAQSGAIAAAAAAAAQAGLSQPEAPPVPTITLPDPPSDQPSDQPLLQSIRISPAGFAIDPAAQLQFTAIGTLSNGSTQDLTDAVLWTSSNPDAATIENGGMATAATVEGSSTVITATDEVTGLVDQTNLTVRVGDQPKPSQEPVLESITIFPDDPVLKRGGQVQLRAIGQYEDGSMKDLSDRVIWETLAPDLVSVGGNGLANATIGLDTGSASITATDAATGITGTTDVTVAASPPSDQPSDQPLLQSIRISPAGVAIDPGAQLQFTAIGTLSNGSTQDLTDAVQWTSSNPDAATIENGGMATAATVEGSSTVITATDELTELADQTNLSVRSPSSDSELVAITVSPEDTVIRPGELLQYTAMGKYSDGHLSKITDSVRWSTSDPGIGVIDKHGVATNSGDPVGTVTITAELDDGTKLVSGSTTLTIFDPAVKSTSWEITSIAGISMGAGVTGGVLQFTLRNLQPGGLTYPLRFIGGGLGGGVGIKGGKVKVGGETLPISISAPAATAFETPLISIKDFNGPGEIAIASADVVVGKSIGRAHFSGIRTKPEWLNIGSLEAGFGLTVNVWQGWWKAPKP